MANLRLVAVGLVTVGALLILTSGAQADPPLGVATVPLGVGASSPESVAVNPLTDRVYVANAGSSSVSVITGAANTVLATVSMASAPRGLAVIPATNRIYVTGGSSGLMVIDGGTNAVVGSVGVGLVPDGVGVNSNANRIYVANGGDNSVSVVDGSTDSVIATVGVGSSPAGVAVNPATDRVYVANRSSDNVSVIDAASNTVIATIPVGDNPHPIAVNPSLGRIYVANLGDSTVSVIDGTPGSPGENTVVTTIGPVIGAADPNGLSVNPITGRVYVANDGVAIPNLSVIDGTTNTVVSTVSGLGDLSRGVAANAATGRVYVTSAANNAVSVLEETVTLTVEVDIKPAGNPNSINLSSGGKIPLAILTVPAFDATQVNPTAMVFAGATAARHSLNDVDSDGDLDLVLHFRIRDTNIQSGDTEACLSGPTFNEQLLIEGCDSVRIVPPNTHGDGDLTTDDVEATIGTEQFAACGIGAWPPDLDDSQFINIQDVQVVLGVWAKDDSAIDWEYRKDLVPDGFINIADVSSVLGFWAQACT